VAVHLTDTTKAQDPSNTIIPHHLNISTPSDSKSPTSSLESSITNIAAMVSDPERDHALEEYKGKLLESREWEAKLKSLRLEIKGLQHDFDVSEDNIKALQSVGQIIGEVLKQLDEERCECTPIINNIYI